MATVQGRTTGTEAAILSRLIRPEEDDLPSDAAEALLRLGFGEQDLSRIHDLVTRNQDDALTPGERAELESYLRVSSLVDLVHAKARHSLHRNA
jgi:hypothetical protein